MIVTRSGETGSLVAATCALFDTRVFLWRLRDEWVSAGQATAAAAVAAGAGSSDEQGQHAGEARDAAWDPAATVAAVGAAAAAGGGDGGQYELRHVYSTLEEEPIVDVSISTTAHRLFVVGMENVSGAGRYRQRRYAGCGLGAAHRHDALIIGCSSPLG